MVPILALNGIMPIFFNYFFEEVVYLFICLLFMFYSFISQLYYYIRVKLFYFISLELLKPNIINHHIQLFSVDKENIRFVPQWNTDWR